jgi:hypothetical protein
VGWSGRAIGGIGGGRATEYGTCSELDGGEFGGAGERDRGEAGLVILPSFFLHPHRPQLVMTTIPSTTATQRIPHSWISSR